MRLAVVQMRNLFGRRTVLGIIAGALSLGVGVGSTAGTEHETAGTVEVDALNLHAFWESQRAEDEERAF